MIEYTINSLRQGYGYGDGDGAGWGDGTGDGEDWGFGWGVMDSQWHVENESIKKLPHDRIHNK